MCHSAPPRFSNIEHLLELEMGIALHWQEEALEEVSGSSEGDALSEQDAFDLGSEPPSDEDALSEQDTLYWDDGLGFNLDENDFVDTPTDHYALAQEEEERQWMVYLGFEPPRDEDDWDSIRDSANRGLADVFGIEYGADAWEPADWAE